MKDGFEMSNSKPFPPPLIPNYNKTFRTPEGTPPPPKKKSMTGLNLMEPAVADPGFSQGRRQSSGEHWDTILLKFPKNCKKLRTFWSFGGGGWSAPGVTRLDPPLASNVSVSFKQMAWWPVLFIWQAAGFVWDSDAEDDEFFDDYVGTSPLIPRAKQYATKRAKQKTTAGSTSRARSSTGQKSKRIEHWYKRKVFSMCRLNLKQGRSRGPLCHHKPAQHRHLTGGMITLSLTHSHHILFVKCNGSFGVVTMPYLTFFFVLPFWPHYVVASFGPCHHVKCASSLNVLKTFIFFNIAIRL